MSALICVIVALFAPDVSDYDSARRGAAVVVVEQRAADSAAVMAVVKGFKSGLASGDSTKVISFLHNDLIVFESRQAENLTQYRSGHLAADMSYLKTVTQTTTKETLVISGDLAVYT